MLGGGGWLDEWVNKTQDFHAVFSPCETAGTLLWVVSEGRDKQSTVYGCWFIICSGDSFDLLLVTLLHSVQFFDMDLSLCNKLIIPNYIINKIYIKYYIVG